MLTNPVFWSVVILLALAAMRLNVLLSLVLASIAGGLMVAQGIPETLKIFVGGLGNGAS
ncbi:MAG: sodium:proton antiporter, partial [Lentisphaeria bacterium]|nr:sodium:proton antiporter [Lentisphaeria bacterium]